MDEQKENGCCEDCIYNLETTTSFDRNAFTENNLNLEETTATEERKSVDDENQENQNKDLIEETPQDKQGIKFIEQKTINNVNINPNKTPEKEKKTPEHNLVQIDGEIYLEKTGKFLNLYKKPLTIRIDDTRKEAFIFPMIFMKKFLNKRFKLKLVGIKYNKNLAKNISKMKSSLKLTVKEILYYNEKNKDEIKKKLDSDLRVKEELSLNYYLNMTYEELFNRYRTEDINFPFFENGKVRICTFITLEKAIQIKQIQWRKKPPYKNNEELLKKKTKKFKKFSLNMIEDIKEGKLERPGKKKKFENKFEK